jgi:hypothetical protein
VKIKNKSPFQNSQPINQIQNVNKTNKQKKSPDRKNENPDTKSNKVKNLILTMSY